VDRLGAALDVRRATLALASAALLLAASPASARSGRTVLLGRSVEGRAITALEVGDPSGTRILVVGCIHGNEPAGIAVAQRLAHVTPTGIDLWIVPSLNPDGRASGTRGNAHGVDLNRNFPFRWRRRGGVYSSGPRPLSEPEARIAYRLILRLRPTVSVWFHQHLDLVWGSGGNEALERRFARIAGLPYRRLPPIRGSAIDWQNHRLPSTTAFAAELPSGAPTPRAVARYVRATIALGN